MGVISDSINLFGKGSDSKNDMIALPLVGEIMRDSPIRLPDGEKVMGHIESYNRRTKELKTSYTTKDGKTNLMILKMYTTSEEKAKGEEDGEEEVSVFSVSGKLVYLMRPATA